MSCEKYKNALLESAVAGDVHETLRNHLEHCPPCRSTLRREQDVLAKVDNLLRSRMNEEPTIGFLTRVRAEAARPPQPLWNPVGALAAVALALVLIAIANLPTRSRRQPVQSANLASPIISAGQPQDVARSAPAPIPDPGVRVRPPRRVATLAASGPVTNPEPEVLVPPDEAKAFQQFVVRLAERQEVAQAFVNGAAEEQDDLSQIPPVQIADLRLKPLVWEKWK